MDLVNDSIVHIQKLENAGLTRSSIWTLRTIWAPIKINGVEKQMCQELLTQGCCDSYSLGVFFGIIRLEANEFVNQSQLILMRVFAHENFIDMEDVNQFLIEVETMLQDASADLVFSVRYDIFRALHVFRDRNILSTSEWEKLKFPTDHGPKRENYFAGHVGFSSRYTPRVKFIGFSSNNSDMEFANGILPYFCIVSDENYSMNDVVDAVVIYPKSEEQTCALLRITDIWKIDTYIADTNGPELEKLKKENAGKFVKLGQNPLRILVDANIRLTSSGKYIPLRLNFCDFSLEMGVAFHDNSPQILWVKDGDVSGIWAGHCPENENGWCIKFPAGDGSMINIVMRVEDNKLVVAPNRPGSFYFPIAENLRAIDGTFPETAWKTINCFERGRINVCASVCDWIGFYLFHHPEEGTTYKRVDENGKGGFENPDGTIVIGPRGKYLPSGAFSNPTEYLQQFSSPPRCNPMLNNRPYLLNYVDIYFGSNPPRDDEKLEGLLRLFQNIAQKFRFSLLCNDSYWSIEDAVLKIPYSKYFILQVIPFDELYEYCSVHPESPSFWKDMMDALLAIGYRGHIRTFNWVVTELALRGELKRALRLPKTNGNAAEHVVECYLDTVFFGGRDLKFDDVKQILTDPEFVLTNLDTRTAVIYQYLLPAGPESANLLEKIKKQRIWTHAPKIYLKLNAFVQRPVPLPCIFREIASIFALPFDTPVEMVVGRLRTIWEKYPADTVADIALVMMRDSTGENRNVGKLLFEHVWEKYINSVPHMSAWLSQEKTLASGWKGNLTPSDPAKLILRPSSDTPTICRDYPQILFADEKIIPNIADKIRLAKILSLDQSYPDHSIGKVLKEIKEICDMVL